MSDLFDLDAFDVVYYEIQGNGIQGNGVSELSTTTDFNSCLKELNF